MSFSPSKTQLETFFYFGLFPCSKKFSSVWALEKGGAPCALLLSQPELCSFSTKEMAVPDCVAKIQIDITTIVGRWIFHNTLTNYGKIKIPTLVPWGSPHFGANYKKYSINYWLCKGSSGHLLSFKILNKICERWKRLASPCSSWAKSYIRITQNTGACVIHKVTSLEISACSACILNSVTTHSS